MRKKEATVIKQIDSKTVHTFQNIWQIFNSVYVVTITIENL